MTLERSAVLSALSKVIDPELRLPITELGMVGDITQDSVEIKLTVIGCPAAAKIEQDVREALQAALPDASEAKLSAPEVRMSVMTAEERAELTARLRAGRPARTNPFDENTLTKIYLVGSGKGGVGKSSVTANLAVALADMGLRVGLIDADIFGFSIPGQLGLVGTAAKPTRVDDLILPPVAFGVKVISIGMFLDENQPVAWRGPMLHRAVQQFMTDVFWGDLDVLLVDLPPGTGDIAISVGQLLPTAKTIVVTTPQAAAAQVAERSGAVGLQTGQAIFGVIENMAWFETPDGARHAIFGDSGGAAVVERLSTLSQTQVPLLGQIPISTALREGSDTGQPVVLAQPLDGAAAVMRQIAERIAQDPRGLSQRKLDLRVN